jgi:hypothetical protein
MHRMPNRVQVRPFGMDLGRLRENQPVAGPITNDAELRF